MAAGLKVPVELRDQVVAWQNWRNAQYAALCEEGRRVANLQRHDALRAERNPIYAGATRTAEESELAMNRQWYYGTIVPLDIAIKSLLWGCSDGSLGLPELLERAAELMARR